MKGTSPAGTHYFPAFPYTSYQHAKVEDVRDLFAYLKTLPPVPGKVRDHDVPFPFNIRRNVGIWKLLFMDGKPFVPDAAQSAQWNRGAYLVNSLGHCAECHSPRNFLGGIVAAQRFAGGPNPEGEGWVPNITQKGLGEWSAKDIAYFLETGADARRRHRRRLDGARDQEHLATVAGGSRGDGGISQIAAAGRGPAAAEEEGRRQVLIRRDGAASDRGKKQFCALSEFRNAELIGKLIQPAHQRRRDRNSVARPGCPGGVAVLAGHEDPLDARHPLGWCGYRAPGRRRWP